MNTRRDISLWWDQLPREEVGLQRPQLPGNRDADVAIVGAGYTGLWTAYYLLQYDSSLRVTLIDKNYAGFGASGRNGGWVSAQFPVALNKIARTSGRRAAIAMQDTLHATVDEIGRVVDVALRRGSPGPTCARSRPGRGTIGRPNL